MSHFNQSQAAAHVVSPVQNKAARATFRKGSKVHSASSRYYRQWATFEKRAGELEVRCASLSLHVAGTV